MKFADPLFLIALILVIIPILIHFLQFKRYKTVYFSQVAFLKSLLHESKKKNNLKQLLMLLCRIGTIIFTILAFARPYIPLNQSAIFHAEVVAGIYLDNSFSMNGSSGTGTLLDKAKLQAIDLANSFSPGTKYFLLTNNRGISARLGLTKEQLISEMSKVKSSAANMKLSQAVATLKRDILYSNPNATHNIYLLSDFQKNFTDFDAIKKDSLSQLFLIPFHQTETNNLLIDTCWLESPGRLQEQTEVLKVKISNQSDKTYNNIPLKFYLNDSLKALQAVSLKAKEIIETELSYQNLKQGMHYCRVELDDYPITYDNTFYFSYKVENVVQTLVITEENSASIRWFEKLFTDDEQVKLSSMTTNKLQLSRFANYRCIVLLNLDNLSEGLSASLIKFAEEGGSLVVFPGENSNLSNYNQFFKNLNAASLNKYEETKLQIDELNLQHHLFRDVFTRDYERVNLPVILKSYRMQVPLQSLGRSILTNNDGSTSLYEFPCEKGRIYQFSFPLIENATDFFRHALFVPLIYNMALHSYFPQTTQYEVKPNEVILIKADSSTPIDGQIYFTKLDNELRVQIPQTAVTNEYIRVTTSDLIREAGFYNLVCEDNLINALAFNYNRNESDMDFYDIDQLDSIASDNGYQVFQNTSSTWLEQNNLATMNIIELWKYLILLAIALIVTELLIIRFWK